MQCNAMQWIIIWGRLLILSDASSDLVYDWEFWLTGGHFVNKDKLENVQKLASVFLYLY